MTNTQVDSLPQVMINVSCQLDLRATIHRVFPDLEVDTGWDEDPYLSGIYGPNINRHILCLPTEQEFNCSVVAIEENSSFGASTAILLESWVSSGRQKIRRKCWLLGEREDQYLPGKYFFHELPGNSSKFPDFDSVRRWCWRLRGNQVLALIHGQWGFVSKNPKRIQDKQLKYENAWIDAQAFVQDGDRTFLFNPCSIDHSMNVVHLTGWHELRKGRIWEEDEDAEV